tara:strand:- start:841 stop:2127 length:1287 start_codon:yes stop_codon:yes gene_type:complete
MKTLILSFKNFLAIFIILYFHFGCISNEKTQLKQSRNIDTLFVGLDVLEENDFLELQGKKIGLITNHTGVNNSLVQNINLVLNSKNIELKAIFTPEHGLFGSRKAGEKIILNDERRMGIPVYSLYGETKKPKDIMLKNLDAIVFDIQDIGIRSYTYISTMGLAMEAAAENGIEFIVLDRPNPLGLRKVEGNLLDRNFTSFIGKYPIPYVYGLTCGELAIMINEQGWLESKKCNLRVIKMKNYNRLKTYEELDQEWIPTSPHVPHFNTPAYMVATGILGELGVFSNGVGYTIPFRTIAAPWIDSELVAKKMNMLGLLGLKFKSIKYSPFYSLYKGESIEGIQIFITDLNKANLILVQFYFLQIHQELYPDKNPFVLASKKNIQMFDKAIGNDIIRKNFSKNFKVSDIKKDLEIDLDDYLNLSKRYYLYD